MADEAYIAALQRVIGELYGCPSQHLETINVQETLEGKTFWHGDVEVFAVFGNRRAQKCYAWVKRIGRRKRQRRFFAVLGTTLIKTPLDAVKFAHMISTASLIDEFSRLIDGHESPPL